MSYQEESGRDYRTERDAAYTERNKVVAGLAAMVLRGGGRAWLADHKDEPGENWDPEWRNVVFIEGPTGQLSWHLHDSDVVHFLFLPRGENQWDGHTSEAKYNRIAQLAAPAPQPPADEATHVYQGDGERPCVRMLGRPGEQQIQCDQPPASTWHAVAPAGPPVTGDGDVALVREIAEWWGAEIPLRRPTVDEIQLAERAYAAGLARGRALGARDENEKCERLVRDAVVEASMAKNGKLALALHNLADEIARRAGRGQC